MGLDGHRREIQEVLVRGEGTFAPTVRGIERLLAAGVPVRVGTVVHAGNEAFLSEMIALCASLGVQEVIFSRMAPVGRMQSTSPLLSRAPVERYLEQLAPRSDVRVSHSFCDVKAPAGNGTCPGGERFLFIYYGGFIAPCSLLVDREPDVRSGASLKTTPLGESSPVSDTLSRFRLRVSHRPDECPVGAELCAR